MGFWKALYGILRPRVRPMTPGEGAYVGLRNQVLSLQAGTLGNTTLPGGTLMALLMETAYAEAVVSLVVVADGTVSLYFSTGGGMIGLGAHEGPREAGEKFLSMAPAFTASMEPAYPSILPPPGTTQFLAVTTNGLVGASAREQDLGLNRHRLSPLFHAGHEVITQARLHSERSPQIS